MSPLARALLGLAPLVVVGLCSAACSAPADEDVSLSNALGASEGRAALEAAERTFRSGGVDCALSQRPQRGSPVLLHAAYLVPTRGMSSQSPRADFVFVDFAMNWPKLEEARKVLGSLERAGICDRTFEYLEKEGHALVPIVRDWRERHNQHDLNRWATKEQVRRSEAHQLRLYYEPSCVGQPYADGAWEWATRRDVERCSVRCPDDSPYAIVKKGVPAGACGTSSDFRCAKTPGPAPQVQGRPTFWLSPRSAEVLDFGCGERNTLPVVSQLRRNPPNIGAKTDAWLAENPVTPGDLGGPIVEEPTYLAGLREHVAYNAVKGASPGDGLCLVWPDKKLAGLIVHPFAERFLDPAPLTRPERPRGAGSADGFSLHAYDQLDELPSRCEQFLVLPNPVDFDGDTSAAGASTASYLASLVDARAEPGAP